MGQEGPKGAHAVNDGPDACYEGLKRTLATGAWRIVLSARGHRQLPDVTGCVDGCVERATTGIGYQPHDDEEVCGRGQEYRGYVGWFVGLRHADPIWDKASAMADWSAEEQERLPRNMFSATQKKERTQ
jgi:hypothetical protein